MKKLLFLFLLIPAISQAITPVFCCGFECGVATAHWSGSNQSISTAIKKTADRAGRVNPTATTGYFGSSGLTSSNMWVIRCYIRFETLPSVDINIVAELGHQDGAWFKASDSKIYAGSENGGLGATGVSVTTGVWYRIDVKANKSANPHLIDVQINGVACGQASNSVASGSTSGFHLGSFNINYSGDIYFDDVVASNTSADYPIGAGYVNHFVPTADGTHSGLTANDYERTLTGTDILNTTTDSYLLLDDIPMESGSSVDWINMVAPVADSYTENIFGPAPGISTPTVAPRAVEVISAYHQAGTGVGNMRLTGYNNGTTVLLANFYNGFATAGVTTVTYVRRHFPEAFSGGAWTVDKFNNSSVQFQTGSTVDANPDQYFDCIMIEAEFAEVVLTIPGTPSDKRFTNLGVGLIKLKK